MYIADATLNGAQQGRIPLRGTNGKIYVKTASIDEDEAVVNRKYVDDLIASLTSKIEELETKLAEMTE